MFSDPKKIYEEFENKSLNKNSAIELLISLIENLDDNEVRLDSIKILDEKIGALDASVFKLCENLLVSDSNPLIRNAACLYIKNHFLFKALNPMKWAIQHEKNYDCIINIIKTLENVNNAESKTVLIAELKKLLKRKFMDERKEYENIEFIISLKILFETRKVDDLTNYELAEILVNYKTIAVLINKFYTLKFEWENGLVIDLDLSKLGFIDKPQFASKLTDLSEVIGLKHLNHLKKLNLSNNRLTTIKDLAGMKYLTNLYLSGNELETHDNIEYLKKLPSLKYLDISENNLAYRIDKSRFENVYIKSTKALDLLLEKLSDI